MKLAYSKGFDSLPIQSTKLAESTPCYIPFETQRNGISDAEFLETEIDRTINDCTDVYGYKFDDRYSKIGDYQISEYDLQEGSGVIDLIEDLPNTDNVYGRKVDLKSREDVMFNLYTRPTIPFKLECESSSSRKELASAISSTVSIVDNNYIQM